MTESPARLVREFHTVFGLVHPDGPTGPPDELVVNRQRLLPVFRDGRARKGDGFRPPDVAAVQARQGPA